MKKYPDLLTAAKEYESAKCFIFDMDGLIFDTERLFMEQLALVMAKEGYRLTREVYCQSLGMTGEPLKQLMLAEYGEDYPFQSMGQKAREQVNLIADTVGLQLKPQIRSLLEWLKERDIVCAVASSTNSDIVKNYLEKAEIFKFFTAIVGGEMVERSKPEPEIFLLACEKCRVSPGQAVVLEDSENGVKAAFAAGIPSICVPDLKQPSEEVCRMASAVVKTI